MKLMRKHSFSGQNTQHMHDEEPISIKPPFFSIFKLVNQNIFYVNVFRYSCSSNSLDPKNIQLMREVKDNRRE